MIRLRLFFLTLCMTAFLAASCGFPSSAVPLSLSGGETLPLAAITASAKKGVLASSGSAAWFGFPEGFSPRAVVAEIEISPPQEASVFLAFAGPEDFDSAGKPRSIDSPRAVARVSGSASRFVVRMEAPSSPVSAVVIQADFQDSAAVRVVSITETAPEYGWSKKPSVLSASFSSQGGSFDPSRSIYPALQVQGESTVVVDFAPSADSIGSRLRQERESFLFAESVFAFRRTARPGRSLVPSFLLTRGPFAQPSVFEPANPASPFIESVRLVPGTAVLFPESALQPVPADPRQILLWPQNRWRQSSYEAFSWDRFPSILIFDTADYYIQDRFFKRLAFFVEKKGYRGHLWTNDEIGSLHAFNAHDYRAESLAEFFTRAKAENFNLNPEEELLRDILEANGVILPSGDGWAAGSGAVLSLSRQSKGYLRTLFMTHESFHGLYFIDPDFRSFVSSVYAAMDERDIAFLHEYFTAIDSLGYDPADGYLMENEFMAYLLQQPLAQVEPYFVSNLRERFLRYKGSRESAEWIESTKASGFVKAAEQLNEYVFRRWGVEGGRVSLFVSTPIPD